MPRSLLSSLVVGMALAAGPAAAQLWATQLDPGDFYLDLGGAGAYVDLPETQGFMFVGPVGSPATTPIDGEGGVGIGGVNGGAGYVLCDCAGRSLRLELGGFWAGGDTDETHVFPDPIEITIPTVDGIAAGTGSTQIASSGRTRLDYTTWGIDLLARTDFGDEEGFQFSPFVGFTHDTAKRDEDFTWGLAGDDPLVRTDHSLVTDHYGGALGATLAFPLGGGLWLAVETRADLLYADADLDASQRLASNFSQASDSESGFAARVGGTIGLSKQFGPVVVGLEGTGSWLSWSPQAVYPFTTGPSVPPARLDDDDAWNAGGGLKVTVPF